MILHQAADVKASRQVDSQVQLRPIPHPYQAMLAICSDLDETPDRRVYWEIMRFLNTTGDTAMGPGVGLEVGNTIYFDMPPDQFAYWNADDAGREMIRTLIKSGHIDCLHSYGDLATTRDHAAKALDDLDRHDCRLEVWIDHGTAATNLDPDIMQGHGDEAGHPAYHADLTTDYGVQYVWRGRVTSVIGQDVRPRLCGIFNGTHPIASGRTLLKEAAKSRLARAGNAKYAMHGPNETLRRTTLRDGRGVYEFMRCNPHWGGVSSCDQGRHIGKVLTREMLDRLAERGGTCVLYTHLGKIDDPRIPFDAQAVAAFRRLAEEFHAGRILVTTTRRLLGYRRALCEIEYSCRCGEDGLKIDVRSRMGEVSGHRLSPADLASLTFYVPDSQSVRVEIDGAQVPNLRRNPPDHTGRPSVSVPWPQLDLPTL
jgi:hypothetical protein